MLFKKAVSFGLVVSTGMAFAQNPLPINMEAKNGSILVKVLQPGGVCFYDTQGNSLNFQTLNSAEALELLFPPLFIPLGLWLLGLILNLASNTQIIIDNDLRDLNTAFHQIEDSLKNLDNSCREYESEKLFLIAKRMSVSLLLNLREHGKIEVNMGELSIEKILDLNRNIDYSYDGLVRFLRNGSVGTAFYVENLQLEVLQSISEKMIKSGEIEGYHPSSLNYLFKKIIIEQDPNIKRAVTLTLYKKHLESTLQELKRKIKSLEAIKSQKAVKNIRVAMLVSSLTALVISFAISFDYAYYWAKVLNIFLDKKNNFFIINGVFGKDMKKVQLSIQNKLKLSIQRYECSIFEINNSMEQQL